MTISPLIRRVNIYLLLSTIAVLGTNSIGLNQEGAYKIYIPLFIMTYVLSQWFDNKFTQSQATKEPQDIKAGADDAKGFSKNSKP